MDIVERLRGRSEYERNLGINLIYLHHIDVENICKEIERLRKALRRIDRIETYQEDTHTMLYSKLGIARDIARAALKESE